MMNNAIAGSWEEWEREDFTPEEIAESDLRVELTGDSSVRGRSTGFRKRSSRS